MFSAPVAVVFYFVPLSLIQLGLVLVPGPPLPELSVVSWWTVSWFDPGETLESLKQEPHLHSAGTNNKCRYSKPFSIHNLRIALCATGKTKNLVLLTEFVK